jgi:hypothetical protein
MEAESRPGWLWLVLALIVTLFCCLCVLVIVGGASFLVVRSADGGMDPSPVQEETQSVPTPVRPPDGSNQIPDEAFETLQALRDTFVPIADPIDLAQRLTGLPEISRTVSDSAEPIETGAVKTFWASDVDTNENFQLDAELTYATDHVYFWVEQGVDVNLNEVRDLVDTFEDEIYPTNRAFFGSEWSPGVDGDEHLYILFARGLGFSIAGYFASNDSYPPAVHEFSNGHEMFYLSADNLDLTDEFTYGVLAHEFQHMIHWNLDRNEETWMNEGFAEVAALLNEYDVGGFDFAYASRPDQILTYWPSEPGTAGGHYGQAFLFLAYYLQRFGPEATQALVANPENGLDSIDGALAELGELDENTGALLTADDVYRDWAVAMVLQEPAHADGRYAISIYNGAPRANLSDEFTSCPVSPEQRAVFPYGVDYVRIRCDAPHRVVFEGANLTQVVPADPHSGDYAFWSNRGDESDMTLTRAFDLTGASGDVVLDYWVWYDIEEGWDYLYLEVSADGGETWEILRTPSGTDDDPSGNSFGWAYTATSGGSSRAEWIQESIDLSDYAGQEILLRFEYVTDAAVNGEGLLLDDVSIDAIGYAEDFEDGEGDWQAAGFARIYNRLPQTYRLALIERGDDLRVTEVPLSEDGRAVVDLPFGASVDEFTLVIVNTARHTWQAAPYTLTIEP